MFDPKTDIAGIRRFQSEIRSVIRRSALTSNERDVCTTIVNMWWGKNRNSLSARGLGIALVPIHPGTEKIARQSKVGVRSTYRAMKVLKALSIIRVVEHEKGGRYSARLQVCFHHILALEKQTKEALRLIILSDLKGCHLSDLTPDILADGISTGIGKEPFHENVIVFDPARRNPKGRPL